MTYQSWNDYQDALAAYNAAKALHQSAVRDYDSQLRRYDKDSHQAEIVKGYGCFAAIIACFIAVANGVAGLHWRWLFVYFIAYGLYCSLDQKCRFIQKRRYLEAVSPPIFTFEQPTYAPINDGDPDSPKNDPSSKTEGTLSFVRALHNLGLTGRPTHGEVKRAYRNKIREYHPDKVAHLGSELRDLAECKSKEINAAYEYLSKAFHGDS
jgi:hypothetical protein